MILDEIIDLATDDTASLAVVLRKCLVLAHVLKNDRLKSWAQSELNGYDPDAELPDYRKSAAGAKGNFMGPFGSALNNFVILPQCLDEDDRHHAQYALLNQAVAAYEDLLRLSAVKGMLTLHWSNNMIGYYMDRLPMNGGLQLVDAWQEIPRSAFTQLLDTVRNRALSLALELKDEVGEDDAALKQLSQTSNEKVEQTVVQQIFHGTVYLASGNASMQIQNNTLTPGDWNQLAKILSNAGIAPAAVDELSKEILADKASTGSPLGTRVLDWIKKQGPNVLAGGVKISASVGQSLLTEYLKQHYGIH
jgi:hypothetical protein